MKRHHLTWMILVAVLAMIIVSPVAADEDLDASLDNEQDAEVVLSSYWHPRIRQWDGLIREEAERRALDPDFLASVVWMESRGRPQAVGPVGAVGLMQVMPSEEGFTWRPAKAELMDPGTNLFWGARTLETVVEQGKGDIFNALAAYNGGWNQIQYRGPKHFATTIMRDYAGSLARRHNLLWSERWLAIFAIAQPEVKGPIWIADSTRDDVYFYSNDNWIPEGSLLIPEDVPPTATLSSFKDENGTPCAVGVWFYLMEEDTWLTP